MPKTSLVLLSLTLSSLIRHHLLSFFLLGLLKDCSLSLVLFPEDDPTATPELTGLKAPSIAAAEVVADEDVERRTLDDVPGYVVGLVTSGLGADVGAAFLWKRDIELSEERDDKLEVLGETSIGVDGSVSDTPPLVSLICALNLGLCTALVLGLPFWLYAPFAPNECGVENGTEVICRRKVS